jgi:FkbH-like protein
MSIQESDIAGSWLRRAQWQETLFSSEPARLDLLRLKPEWACVPLRLRVHRNQAFEFVASVLTPFLAFDGRVPEISYSDYDDSLAFRLNTPANVELLWLDFERYRERMTNAELIAWLQDRVTELRAGSAAPILIADSPGEADAEINEALVRISSVVPGVRIVPMSEICIPLGSRVFDVRAARVTGMRLSDAACILAARALGLTWLPAAVTPRVKAIVLDLDNTLYNGVLGEDGPAGLQLTPAHEALHRQFLMLRDQGIYLALASRNEASDVDRLFMERPDFLLRSEHFSARSIAFRDKPTGLNEIARALRIAPDAILFVDDNPGEIAAVAGEIPGIRILHAADTALAVRALQFYPGLHGYPSGRDDARRIADLSSAGERARMAHSYRNPEDYLRSLEVVLTFAIDATSHLGRMAELSVKTNQFNTAFLRLSEAQVAHRLADPECRNVTIALRDRLSDSGTVAVLFLRRYEATLFADEMVISCRALGRGIEEFMVTEALRLVLQDLPAREVRFAFTEGPRNGPARDFLTAYTGKPIGPGGVTISWDEERAAALMARFPVTAIYEQATWTTER